MIQSLLLGALVILCILLVVTIIRSPLDNRVLNPCRFKILPPKYTVKGNKKHACFNIIVERKHRYFINFPLLFKFYSDSKFRTKVKIFYSTPGDKRHLLMDKEIEVASKIREFVVHITDVIMGKILIEVELEVSEGNPTIGFEIMSNNNCTLMKEQKLELNFPQ